MMTSNVLVMEVQQFTEVVSSTLIEHGIHEVVIRTLSTGEVKTYNWINGTFYHKDTPKELIRVLERIRGNKDRYRFYLGDSETGLDWCEEHDVMGVIGRSCGEVKIPILRSSKNASGGGGILDHCIVKITESRGGRVVWKHPNYHQPSFEIVDRGNSRFPANKPDEYVSVVFRNGNTEVAAFRKRRQAEGYVAFMKGETNSKVYGLYVAK